MLCLEFNYNRNAQGMSVNQLDVYATQIEDIVITQAMIGSSAATFQLPRLSGIVTLLYDSSTWDGDDIWRWFAYTAQKGMVVRMIDYSLPDAESKAFYFLLESYSVNLDEHRIKATLVPVEVSCNTLVQFGSRLTPLEITDDTLKEMGLKNVYRLPIQTTDTDVRRTFICPENIDEMLLALAWAYNGHRHNIGFAPAAGVDATGKIVLVPEPSAVKDGVPVYSVEPDDLISKVDQEPEIIVSDILTGTLERGKLVPIVAPVTVTSLSDYKLRDCLKIFTVDGEIVAWAAVTGVAVDTISLDTVYLGGIEPTKGVLSDGASLFAVTKATLQPPQGNAVEVYVLFGHNGNTVHISALDSGKKLYSVPLVGSPIISMNPNEFESRALHKQNVITVNDRGDQVVLLPRIGSDTVTSSSNDFALFVKSRNDSVEVKSVGAQGLDQLTGMYPIDAYLAKDIGVQHVNEARILLVDTNYGLTGARVATVDANSGSFKSAFPIEGASLPTGTDGDWSKVTYYGFKKSNVGLNTEMIVYSVPRTDGKTAICLQPITFDFGGRDMHLGQLVTEVVDNFMTLKFKDANTPLVVVTTDGWIQYDIVIDDNNRNALLESSHGDNSKWGNITEAASAGGVITLSEEVGEEAGKKTRIVYVMSVDSPFDMYALGSRKVQNVIESRVPYNARDLSCVIDLPYLKGGGKIPRLRRKVVLDVAGFDYRVSAADGWIHCTAEKLDTPLLGTLIRFKQDPRATEYQVGILAGIESHFDGVMKLSLTVVIVDDPPYALVE